MRNHWRHRVPDIDHVPVKHHSATQPTVSAVNITKRITIARLTRLSYSDVHKTEFLRRQDQDRCLQDQDQDHNNKTETIKTKTTGSKQRHFVDLTLSKWTPLLLSTAMFQAQNRETIHSTWKLAVSSKIIMTTSVTRSCFTTQHQTCKTKTKTIVCKTRTKTKTDFFGLRPVFS